MSRALLPLPLLLALGAMPACAQVFEVGDDGTLREIGAPARDAPAEAPPPASAIAAPAIAAVPSAYRDAVSAAARDTGLSPWLIDAVARSESGYDADAVSPAGALGIMQLMPATARELGVDPRDPAQNIAGGALYLRRMLDRFDGDLELALAAYNAGTGNVLRHGGVPPFRETRDYVRRNLARLASASDAGAAPAESAESIPTVSTAAVGAPFAPLAAMPAGGVP